MTSLREIRADFDRETIVVYQAYREEIGRAAVEHQRFVPPFSLGRMTWIKPSFLWMMERSNWGRKDGQTWVLGVRIRRSGFEEALSQAVLTSPEPDVYANADVWRRAMAAAAVHVQWDPERSLRGAKLDHRSIQIGLSRAIIEKYVKSWVLEIRDIRDLVARIRKHRDDGDIERARRLLPVERPYPLPPSIAARVGAA